MTWKGFTLYGSADVSLQYETHGAPVGPLAYSSLAIITPAGRTPTFLIAPNQLSQSGIGIKTKQDIGEGFSFVGKADTGFIPTTGRLADALGAIRQQNGIPTNLQSASFDGPRAGQPFNGDLYAGISHPIYGTLAFGRQTTFTTENILLFDPLASYGFSLLGGFGFFGGAGSSELVRVDQSVKYTFIAGPFHGGVLFATPDSSVKTFYQASAGIEYGPLAIDLVGSRGADNVSVGALSGAGNVGSRFLGARVFDSASIQVVGRYTYDLAPGSNVGVSGGWQRIDFSNPTDGGYGPGHTVIGGYPIGPGFSRNGLTGGGIVNYAYTGGDRVLTVGFITIRYQYDPSTSVSAGYYHLDQNSFGLGVPSLYPAAAAFYSSRPCKSRSLANCSGSEEVASVRVDYRYNRNITLYSGGAFSIVYDGLAFGYLKRQEISLTSGIRVAF